MMNYEMTRSGAGPFDMVFCVGPLTSATREAELASVLEGRAPPIVPIYFFEPGPSESLAAKLEEHPCEEGGIVHDVARLGSALPSVHNCLS